MGVSCNAALRVSFSILEELGHQDGPFRSKHHCKKIAAIRRSLYIDLGVHPAIAGVDCCIYVVDVFNTDTWYGNMYICTIQCQAGMACSYCKCIQEAVEFCATAFGRVKQTKQNKRCQQMHIAGQFISTDFTSHIPQFINVIQYISHHITYCNALLRGALRRREAAVPPTFPVLPAGTLGISKNKKTRHLNLFISSSWMIRLAKHIRHPSKSTVSDWCKSGSYRGFFGAYRFTWFCGNQHASGIPLQVPGPVQSHKSQPGFFEGFMAWRYLAKLSCHENLSHTATVLESDNQVPCRNLVWPEPGRPS